MKTGGGKGRNEWYVPFIFLIVTLSCVVSGCNGDDGGVFLPTEGAPSPGETPPAGAPPSGEPELGVAKVTANGGTASGVGRAGGNGGSIRVTSTGPAGVNASKFVDAVFPPPTAEPGANPRIFSVSESINLDDGTPACSTTIPGTTDPASRATGLVVESGVVVTLQPDPDCANTAFITVSADIEIKGEVTTTHIPNTLDTSGLRLEAKNILIRAGASLSTKGDGNVPGVDGGNGGPLTLVATGGSIVDQGFLESSGGEGAADRDGGIGGDITLLTQASPDVPPGSIRVSGDIFANGGNGRNGGASGNIAIAQGPGASEGISLSGYHSVEAKGGTGTGVGGAGGAILLVSDGGGKTINSVDILANGGDATDPGSVGGNGGQITLHTVDVAKQPTENTALLSVTGGTGTTPGLNGTVFIDGVQQP